MFNKLKIRTKLLVVFIIIGIVPLGVVTVLALSNASTALHDEVLAKFSAVQEIKRNHIESYFENLRATLKITQNDPYVQNAMGALAAAYKRGDNTIDTEDWHNLAERYDLRMKKIVEDNGWYDLFLINQNGTIIYTAAKEKDLGMNLANGDLKDSGLGKAYSAIQNSTDDAIVTADFEPYSPSNGDQTAFMMAKMTSQYGVLRGYVALLIPSDQINAIIQQRTGLGNSGESFLVGQSDGKSGLRSDRVVRAGKIGDPEMDEFIEKALQGQAGTAITTGDNGIKVFERYDPVKIEGLNWCMITTANAVEMLSAVSTLRNTILVIIALVIAGIVALALWFTGTLTHPIQAAVLMLKDIAQGEGDLTKRLQVSSQDEIGDMGNWFNSFMEKLQVLIKEIGKNTGVLNDASTSLSTISSQLSGSAETMSGRSSGVASATEEMSTNMNSVAAASEQAATNVNMVAAATEEMTSTVQEIARNSEKARTVTDSAVTQANGTSVKVGELGSAAREIGKVTETITEISEQTNLLALNATIEAARAGDAGKGFAVVANEIKELAKQTAQATQEIKSQIEDIQGSTSETVSQIEQITAVINEVNEIVSTIATAVEEQAVTSQEIAEKVSQASQGIQEVNENVSQSSTVAGSISGDIAEVNQSVHEISNSSGQVNRNAEELSKLSGRLQDLVGRFKV